MKPHETNNAIEVHDWILYRDRVGRISNLKIQKFVYPRDVSFQLENFVFVFSLVGRKIFSHRLLCAYSLSTRVITHRGNSKTASSSTKLRDLNHSPTVSSSFIPFSHYLLFNRKIKHVNPPRPLPFVFFIGRAQLVWQATTIKRALRERKEAGIVDASVQMLILIPGERQEETERETESAGTGWKPWKQARLSAKPQT